MKFKEVHMSKWGRVGRGRRWNARLPTMEIGLIFESDYSSSTIIFYSQELPVIGPLERKNFLFLSQENLPVLIGGFFVLFYIL